MEKGNTKQEILDAALDLFSRQGYEATSISQIAEAVGVRKSSLYSHFVSKQDILDTLMQEVLQHYEAHSLSAQADRMYGGLTKEAPLSADQAVLLIREQVRYILHDPCISKARKMLMIEQFQNQELAAMLTKQNYSDIMYFFRKLIESMIQKGTFQAEDSEIMAAQLCLPITVWSNLCDREPEREPQVMELIERHVRQFFRLYAES